ncbi:DEAD/DEAH box helicase [Xanthomonas hydrangeae]|uniref:DEAD/DEAH box helicase n=1 Tax=Xanthomonas hydrangeae TaxID=2775159 RepID=A0AAU0BFN2_9XANT|nr:DEAD/DEAH box helicase [Xanthomonas hydrangeae]WOB50721.1 DEAD/DEAH box helicase [Xanthomonas hydrangeae]
MTEFADQLTERIVQHPEFWSDFNDIRAAGARGSMHGADFSLDMVIHEEAVNRLLYCASVFAQASDEISLSRAQAIALSALFVSKSEENFSASLAILSQIGNFPGVNYISRSRPVDYLSLANQLQIHLLAELNTVSASDSRKALTDFQMRVWSMLPYLRTASISAPTSAGKSFVVLEYLCDRVKKSDSTLIVYVAPTRALLAEVSRKLMSRLGGHQDVAVSTVPAADASGRPKQIYILTQERLSALLSVSSISPNVLIVDEAQNLADGSRGMILQDCIQRVRDRSPSCQVLLLSPGATGFEAAMETTGISDVAVNETALSPVLQNRIVVTAVPGNSHELELGLLEDGKQISLGRARITRGVTSAKTRLAAVALEFGSEGGNLVYATGPADAERLARSLAIGLNESNSNELIELDAFIREHIHSEYGLADMVRHGVAFHYGKMPALLREAIESAFQSGAIKFLVCTTTLFQGVNLPARNVFMNTPTRGKGVQLDPALIWNFAGRAGRLNQDVVGNVFLVDYNSWETSPLDNMVRVRVTSALSDTIGQHAENVELAVKGEPFQSISAEDDASIRAAAGYIIARSAKGTLVELLGRVSGLSIDTQKRLADAGSSSINLINLPASIIEANWTVDPHGMARLRCSLDSLKDAGDLERYIPCDPGEERAFKTYSRIFNLMADKVLGYKVEKYGLFVANYALQWMRGVPYPVLVSKWVKSKRSKATRKKASVDGYVRTAFEFIEDELRFKWVQLGRAYVDIIRHVAPVDLRSQIHDFSLALELGVSSLTARSFVEIGLSRIAAAALAELHPNSELTVPLAKNEIAILDLSLLRFSPVIAREVAELRATITSEV